MKKLTIWLLISFCVAVLGGCAISSDISETPSDTAGSTNDRKTTTTLPTASLGTPTLPPTAFAVNESNYCHVLKMGNIRLTATQQKDTACFFFTDADGEQQLFFGALGKATGIKRLDDERFLIEWYTSYSGRHALIFSADNLYTPQFVLPKEYIRATCFKDTVYYTALGEQGVTNLYSLSIDDHTHKQPVLEEKNTARDLYVQENRLYFCSENKLLSKNLETKQVELVCEVTEGQQIRHFSLLDEWLFYECGYKTLDMAGEYSYAHNVWNNENTELDIFFNVTDVVADDTCYYMTAMEQASRAAGIYAVQKDTLAYTSIFEGAAFNVSIYDGKLYFSASGEIQEIEVT